MERKVRGIDVILKAADRKKKEIPIQFAPNWNGELNRIGYKAVWRHCHRYNTPFSLEDMRDAAAEVVADFFEQGKLDSSLEENKLNLSQEEKIQFCREVVNAYRRQIHFGRKTQAETTLDVIIGMGRYYQWRPNSPEYELEWIETKESLRQVLSRMDYATCQLLIQGYSKEEVAEILKVTRRTLRRRLDRLPSGKLLRILK